MEEQKIMKNFGECIEKWNSDFLISEASRDFAIQFNEYEKDIFRMVFLDYLMSITDETKIGSIAMYRIIFEKWVNNLISNGDVQIEDGKNAPLKAKTKDLISSKNFNDKDKKLVLKQCDIFFQNANDLHHVEMKKVSSIAKIRDNAHKFFNSLGFISDDFYNINFFSWLEDKMSHEFRKDMRDALSYMYGEIPSKEFEDTVNEAAIVSKDGKEVDKKIEMLQDFPKEKIVEFFNKLSADKIQWIKEEFTPEEIERMSVSLVQDVMNAQIVKKVISQSKSKTVEFDELSKLYSDKIDFLYSRIPAKTKKRHFFNDVDYKFESAVNGEKDTYSIELSEKLWSNLLKSNLWMGMGFGKTYAGILSAMDEKYSFQSKINLIAKWIYSHPGVFDMKYIDAGNAWEPVIIEYLQKTLKGTTKTTENGEIVSFDSIAFGGELFGKRKDAFNFFTVGNNNLREFNGRPDAVAIYRDAEKKLGILDKSSVVYEIKTVKYSKLQKLMDKGSTSDYNYINQVIYYGLYLGVDEVNLVYYGLEDHEYDVDCEKKIDPNRIKIFNYKIKEENEYSPEAKKVLEIISKIKEFKNELIKSSDSTWRSHRKLIFKDVKADKVIVEYLKCRNDAEFEKFLKTEALRLISEGRNDNG